MQIYKVGGAVRDRLLGKPVTDIDWVVVGATTEEMLAKGFRPVGADFPVFLHPKPVRNTPSPGPNAKAGAAMVVSPSTPAPKSPSKKT